MANGDPPSEPAEFVVFAGGERVAVGALAEAAVAAHAMLERDPHTRLLMFDRTSGEVRDLDLRGDAKAVATRYAPAQPDKPRRGRPKLGVTAREVTLLPRHWEWLARQPGGASTTLRKLIDTARRTDAGASEARARTEAAYRFMSAMAGDLPGFEEASRALFAGHHDDLAALAAPWAADIRSEILRFLGA